MLDFRDRELYDKLSLSYVKSGIFDLLIRQIVTAVVIPAEQFSAVARIFELCACHTSGILIMAKYLK